MPPEDNLSLPFLTRKMLNFEHGVKLQLEMLSYANTTAEIDIIGITREGSFTFKKNHAGNGAAETNFFGIPDVPILVTVHSGDATVRRGAFWASLYLVANGSRILKLCSGYVSRQSSIGWPAAHSEGSLDFRGHHKSISVGNGLNGQNLATTVPTNEWWIIKAAYTNLITDANVANRWVELRLDLHDSGLILLVPSPIVQTASLDYVYNFAPYGTPLATAENNKVFCALPPDLVVGPGNTITFAARNIAATDKFWTCQLAVEQYFQE